MATKEASGTNRLKMRFPLFPTSKRNRETKFGRKKGSTPPGNKSNVIKFGGR